jgi:hypothetical protein
MAAVPFAAVRCGLANYFKRDIRMENANGKGEEAVRK